jgi:hypothetical protein
MSKKAILISTVGRSPMTVTEMIHELEQLGIQVDEVYMIMTLSSAEIPDKVRAQKPHISRWEEIITSGIDLLTEEDAQEAERKIHQTVYQLKQRDDVERLVLDLTGGRKPMSAYLMDAAQLYCDENDLLYHVEATDEFKKTGLWYPQKPEDTRLLEVPYIRLAPLGYFVEEYLGHPFDASDPADSVERAMETLGQLSLMGMLASGIEHEAGKDMFAISGQIKSLYGKEGVSEVEISKLQNGFDNIMGMVRSFLAIGNPQKAQEQFHPAQLTPLIKEVATFMESRFSTTTNSFSIRVSHSPASVEGDRILLKRVFRMLIANAHEAEATEIRITIRQGRNNVVVRISDNGAGMSPSERENAFVPFKSIKGGRGVGLAISRQIIRLHGGSFSIEKTCPGKGTTMKMILPSCPTMLTSPMSHFRVA